MTCAACIARGKTWEGDHPTCGFESGRFSSDNWNCATVGMIRDLVYEGKDAHPRVDYRYCDDRKYATVQVDDLEQIEALALWVSWYKNRGRTDGMVLLSPEGASWAPTEAECLAIVRAAQKGEAKP